MSFKLVTKVAQAMETIAPLSLADKNWDNVGVLISSPINPPNFSSSGPIVMITNDLTWSVCQEAISKNVSCIVSYHPIIFKGLKSVNCCSFDEKPLKSASFATERIVSHCIAKGISVYVPHTALDACFPGINDWLLKSCLYSSSASSGDDQKEIKADWITEAVPVNPIGSSQQLGYGRLLALKTLKKKLTKEQSSIQSIIANLKKSIGVPHLRLALADEHNLESVINDIAVCAGSGSSVLSACDKNVDLFVTGEMSHHDVISANHRGISIILCEHSNTERGYLKSHLRERLFLELKKITGNEEFSVLCSENDRDPLTII